MQKMTKPKSNHYRRKANHYRRKNKLSKDHCKAKARDVAKKQVRELVLCRGTSLFIDIQ